MSEPGQDHGSVERSSIERPLESIHQLGIKRGRRRPPHELLVVAGARNYCSLAVKYRNRPVRLRSLTHDDIEKNAQRQGSSQIVDHLAVAPDWYVDNCDIPVYDGAE